MSRGLGKVEREIIAILKSRADHNHSTLAFSSHRLACDIYGSKLDAIADAVYARSGRQIHPDPTRSMRLTVLQAMHSLARKYPRRYGLAGGKGTTPLYMFRAGRPPSDDDLW
jgi:hypothetical protein